MDNIQQEIMAHNARMEAHGTNLTRVLEAGFGVRSAQGPSEDHGKTSHNKTATELILDASAKFYAVEVDDDLTPEARNAFLDFLSDGQNARRYLMSQSVVDSKYWVRKQLKAMNFLTDG